MVVRDSSWPDAWSGSAGSNQQSSATPSEECLQRVTDIAWEDSQSDFRWSDSAASCGFHPLATAEVQELLEGRQALFVGNSAVRQELFSWAHIALGLGNASAKDNGAHYPFTSILDLTASKMHIIGAPGLCGPMRTDCLSGRARVGDTSADADRRTTAVAEVSWHVTRLPSDQSPHTHGQSWLSRLEASLLRTFGTTSRDLSWAGKLLEPPAFRLREEGPDADGARSAYVQAFFFVSTHARNSTVKEQLFKSVLDEGGNTSTLATWAQQACRGASSHGGRASTLSVGCSPPAHVRARWVDGTLADTLWTSANNLQCGNDSPTPFQPALRRHIERLVPRGNRWAVLSYVFSFSAREADCAISLCESWNSSTLGFGADIVFLAPRTVTEFVPTLLSRRSKTPGSCFNGDEASWATQATTAFIRPAHSGRLAQTEVVAASERLAGLATQKRTLLLPDQALAAGAVRKNWGGIVRPDGWHFNQLGRLFFAQLSLNWVRTAGALLGATGPDGGGRRPR